VFVALDVQHSMHMRHIVNCDLPGSAMFFHIISETARFSEKIENKMCFGFLYKFCPKNFSL